MRPYARDLRLRVVHAYAHHEGSTRQLAVRFRRSLSGVRDRLTRYHITGDVAPKHMEAAIPPSSIRWASLPSRRSCTPPLTRRSKSCARMCPPRSRSR